MPGQLTSLVLHGFKTFAQRTQLDFEGGITAIVGPNGSGKSNLADAFRWALGEQSLRALRGRRTEDVLFAGGPGRPGAGLAEVVVTFDTSAQPLSLPYTGAGGPAPAYHQVAVTRRAYRSGENEYLLNRDRVRLRDVLDVYGRLGLQPDGFALVGQGTVDAALSLRPEDRRALIEQAAAIGHLHQRLREADERLNQTRQNLERLSDLLAEITPRVRSLEQQARQVQERQRLEVDLAHDLVRWFAHRWHGPWRARLAAAETLPEEQAALARDAAELATLDRALSAAQAAQEARQIDHQETGRVLQQLLAEQSARTRAVALDEERAAELAQRGAEAADQQRQLAEAWAEQQAERTELEQQRAALVAKEAEVAQALASLEAQATTLQAERQRLHQTVDRARAALRARETERAALDARQQAATERRAQLIALSVDAAGRLAALEAERVAAASRLAAGPEALAAARAAAHSAHSARDDAVVRLRAAQDALAADERRLAAFDRDRQAIQARYEALRAVEHSGAGYFAGVRTVLQAAAATGPRHLTGVVGVVAQLLEVPAEYELAIETALGGHTQDLVVERWADAEAAISLLKRTGAGRATFLPLDTLRPGRAPAPPDGPGIRGVAFALVRIDPRLAPIAEFLLGHTLVLETLADARRVLRACPPAWQLVTLDGDLTRPSGAVTGGAPGSGRGTLARQRELRALQRKLAEQLAERGRLVDAVTSGQSALEVARQAVSAADRMVPAADDRVREAQRTVAESEHALERVERQLAWEREAESRAASQLAEVERGQATAAAALARLDDAVTAAAAALHSAEAAFMASEAAAEDGTAQRLALRGDQKLVRERLEALDVALRRAAQRERLLAEQRTALADHIRVAAAAGEALVERRSQAESALADLVARLAEQRARAATLERALATGRAEVTAAREGLERRAAAHRRRQQALAERERQLAVAEADLRALREQIEREIGPMDAAALAEGRLRLLTETEGWLVAPIEPMADSERCRERIQAARARLRQLPAGGTALEEFAAARDRQAFLTQQSQDLTEAVETLRQTVAETQSAMQVKFDETFKRVSDTFSDWFRDLFGGGQARLVPEERGDLSGVEVVAQPPGKRSQTLATLSGGERALTAAALLFALLSTAPPPFCVLDEVDAALDESNVQRFCGGLRVLSGRTRFVVMTHNRRTMEAASAIYGLTLHQRSETRVLSLRLPG